MYEIYSNVEDPDGFYGIKTRDVESALYRRLEHEGDHWKSFGVHSAMVEAASASGPSSTSIHLAARDLHRLGFHETSNAVLGMSISAQEESDGTCPLLLECAWRNANWDLPVQGKAVETPAGHFYSALRAVHRERDQEVARTEGWNALRAGIDQLRDLGLERMVQIKRTTADLLCLREIALWMEPETQRVLNEAEFGSEALRRFGEISSSFSSVHSSTTTKD